MEDDDFISKTRRKRQMTGLQEVGKELVALSPEQLARIDMPGKLREAVLECRRFTRHEAVRRQLQYIGRVMRELDPGPIVEQLAALKSPSRRQTALFHVAEKWRDEILADPQAIARFEAQFPRADAERIRALAAGARAERADKRAPKQYRELFHALNAAVQDQARGP
ncbi:MAG TPA: ribosome biogenesis factor YjgA [Myxococcota bacterium]|nr:ribosome biogenesis factor YjgA [Myxococcota bacterium]